MDQQQWKRVNTIVDTALELKGGQRAAYIKEQCREDAELKLKVTELLASIVESAEQNYLENNTYLKNLADDREELEEQATPTMKGENIGNYTIEGLIGHGGMGSVFLAERSDAAYEGKVALKILRRGMDTPSNKARFQRERNILAKLNHPNIARLLDGGVTVDGLPYLVMEYVDGQPLFEYCNAHNLPTEQRLQLFQSICEAVLHAHTNAVIHRDLKPSNILVSRQGQIKILDFGIAKILNPEPPNVTVFQTRTGARMLTPSYAAPEQVEMQPITTATDTYTLGIVLYQLLAGLPPFDLGDKKLTEIEDIIRNKSPEKPSSKVEKQDEEKQQEVVRQRDTTPFSLIKKLRGDLDAIVMKALRKEPEARYSSAEQLLEDLKRRKKNLPIIARKDTFRYKSSKFIRRYAKSLTIAASFLLLIISFGVFYTINIKNERNKAQHQAQKAKEVKKLIASIFQQSDPLIQTDKNITLQEAIDKGSQKINHGLQDQPLIKAELLNVISDIYNDMGLYEKADSLLAGSRYLQQQNQDTTTKLYAKTLRSTAYLKFRTGHFQQAAKLDNHALKLINKHNWGTDKRFIENIYGTLGMNYNEMGKHKKAEMIYRKSLKLSTPAHDTAAMATTRNNLSRALLAQNKFKQAIEVQEKGLQWDRKMNGETNLHVATDYNNLAFTYQRWGKLQKADSLHQIALAMRRKLLPPGHPHIASSLVRYGLLKIKELQPKEAEKMLKEGYDILHEKLPDDHWQVLAARGGLAISRAMQGDFKKNIPILEGVYQTFKNRFGPNDWRVSEARQALTMLYKLEDQSKKARAVSAQK